MRTTIRYTGGLLLVAGLIAACGADDPGPDDAATDPSDGPTPISASESAPDTTAAREATAAGVAFPASAGTERAEPTPDAPVEALAAGLNDAGFDLLRDLPLADNVVFSPASIGHAVLIAEAAGDDVTAAAIDTAFELPPEAHEAWNTLDRQIDASQSEQVTVRIADRIWPRVGSEPDQGWIDLIASRHGVDVVPLDFADGPASQQEINDWVGEKTEGLIRELLTAPPPAGTVMVLTDALYFAADWAMPFGKYGPVNGTFTTVDGTERALQFMHELELADRRGTGDGFVGAEIPYAGGDYSMLVLVPDPGRYEELIERLDQDLLDEIDASFTTGPYELLLPKWEHDSTIDLLPWLTDLGVAPGSFPAISPGAFLGGAVHAADIAVDELGTVAAAVTSLGFEESGPPEPELTVAADRPFVYLIRHRDSGLVLFAGHVTDPTA